MQRLRHAPRPALSGKADESLAAQIVDAAVNLVRSDDADVAEPGARALAVAAPFAGDAAVSPFLLAAHPEERVRRHAVSLWLAADTPPGIIGRLTRDESPGVRAAVAHEAERAAAAVPGEAEAIGALADDPTTPCAMPTPIGVARRDPRPAGLQQARVHVPAGSIGQITDDRARLKCLG